MVRLLLALVALLLHALVLCACGGSGGKPSVLLATREFQHSGSGFTSTGVEFFIIRVGYEDAPAFRASLTPGLTGVEAGQAFETQEGQDADVDATFARLTNGIDDEMSVVTAAANSGNGFLAASGSLGLESALITDRRAELTAPDLAGARIQRVLVTITSASAVLGTNYTYAFTGSIEWYGTLE